MTNFENLRECIERENIIYLDGKEDNIPAMSMRMEQECAIFFNVSGFATEAERFVALSHEKGHCDSGAFYNIHTPLETRGRCEYQAWKFAVLKQLPFDKLMDAFDACRTVDGVTVYDLAEYLSVTPEFVIKAIELYVSAGKQILQSE